VDRNAAPLGELRSLWAEYAPQSALYVARAVDPESCGP